MQHWNDTEMCGQDERAQMDKQQEHEEEVSTVMEENEKLEEELHHAKLLVSSDLSLCGCNTVLTLFIVFFFINFFIQYFCIN